MNILIFSWRDPKHPLAGGAEQVMREHMKGWIQAGHSVTFFSSKMKGLPKTEVLDRVRIIRGGYQYLGVQIAGFFYYLKNAKKFDFLVDQFHGLPFFTPLYTNKPKLAVIQEPAREVWLTNPLSFPLNWIVGLIGYLGEPLVFLFYKRIPFMTGSESAKRELIKLGVPERNISVVPHGVILPKHEAPSTKPETKTITYLGVLSKDKGIEDAIKAFKILSKDSDYQFWVIGKGETKKYEEKVKKLAKSLSKKIKFWGFVDQRTKFDLLSRSWILVNPSMREGWGLVNIEANTMGTPVIAYNSLGLTDSVRDGVSGIIVKKNTPQEMADTVLDLFNNRDLYKRLQIGSMFWSRKFSWKRSKNLSLKLLYNLTK